MCCIAAGRGNNTPIGVSPYSEACFVEIERMPNELMWTRAPVVNKNILDPLRG